MSFPIHKVYITENHADGKATFRPDEAAPVQAIGPLMQQTLVYSTPTPLSVHDNADLEHNIATSKISPITFFPPQDATAACILDFAPGCEGMMHKTNSLDYIMILEGELEFELLGGERKIVKKGEMVIHRDPYHNWRDLSKTEPARFLAVAVGIKGATGGEMIPFTGEV